MVVGVGVAWKGLVGVGLVDFFFSLLWVVVVVVCVATLFYCSRYLIYCDVYIILLC